MTSRRSPGRGQPQATWKDPRRRPELLKAIGAGAAVVLVTALIIFLIQPGGSSSSTPTPAGVQTPVSSLPSGSTGSTGSTGATGSTATSTPSNSTAPSTTLPQP